MPIEPQIREHLAWFLAGRESLSEFEDWFVSATWSLEGEEEAESLAGAIELDLAEYTSGTLSQAQLRAALADLLNKRQPKASGPAPAGPPLHPGTSHRLVR